MIDLRTISKQMKYLTITSTTHYKLCLEIYGSQDPAKKIFYSCILFIFLKQLSYVQILPVMTIPFSRCWQNLLFGKDIYVNK